MGFKSIKELLGHSLGDHAVLRDDIMTDEEIQQANRAYWSISQYETVTGHTKEVFEQKMKFLEAIGYSEIDIESTFSNARGKLLNINNPLSRCWAEIRFYRETHGVQLNLRRIVNFREVDRKDYWVQYSIFPVPELFGCDGTTDFWHHARTYKVMTDIGVDCDAAYRKAYDEDPGPAPVFDESQHIFFTDDPMERANNALYDLYQLNNQSYVDALEELHPGLRFDHARNKRLQKGVLEKAISRAA
ncbi:MAG: hypothetical protein ACD_74C00132G0003 [uncultured bacterium]|nr:MAG: hypothetical protein ACD_74C00132G0003 [uncultured bacterium]